MGTTALKRLVLGAAAAGVCAGLLLTAAQRLQVIPLILQAEGYEQAAAAASGSAPAASEHGHDASPPAQGAERALLTAVANVVVGLGFALLLCAAISLRAQPCGWRGGLLWGAAAYVVFFAAPSLGLPPELPGAVAAELSARQLWWVLAVGFTAAGLTLIAFARHQAIRLLGGALLVVPHLIGAPQPQHGASAAAPTELAHAFIVATAIANAVFWLALGGLAGFCHDRLVPDHPG